MTYDIFNEIFVISTYENIYFDVHITQIVNFKSPTLMPPSVFIIGCSEIFLIYLCSSRHPLSIAIEISRLPVVLGSAGSSLLSLFLNSKIKDDTQNRSAGNREILFAYDKVGHKDHECVNHFPVFPIIVSLEGIKVVNFILMIEVICTSKYMFSRVLITNIIIKIRRY